MRTIGFCEINPWARGVLAKHWSNIPCSEDVTLREFVEGEADVICGGFPCQDISCADERTGITGDRSGLWRELLRAIRVVRPIYAIVENVAALLGRGMGTVLGDLAEIGQDAEWHCIPARSVGAPHIRDRVWIIVADPSRRGYGLDGIGEALKRQLAYTSENMAYPDIVSEGRLSERKNATQSNTFFGREDVANANAERLEIVLNGHAGQCTTAIRTHTWSSEPDVGRMAYGIPSRVDRLKGLGNAVVPQIPELIGRAIMSVHGKRP